MDELVRQIFLQGRDQYDRALRWAFTLVIAGLVLHLTVFSEVIHLKRGLAENREAIAVLSSSGAAFDDISKKLEDLQESTVGFLDTRLKDLVAGLRDDFAQLSRLLRQPPSEVSIEARLPPMIQQPLAHAQLMPEPSFLLDPELIRRFYAASDFEQRKQFLQDDLSPIVDEQIIKVRFAELNRQGTQHLAAIRTHVDAITRVIDRNQPDYTRAADILESRTISGSPQDGAANQLAEIETALQSVIDNAELLRFDPPQDATWWTTVEGKDRSRVEIHRNAASQLAGTLTATEVVGKLVKDIAAAMVAQTTRQDELHSRLEEIKQQLKEQQKRLASVSKPFEFLTIDVELFTSKFPLVLGVILGLALVWPTYRRGHLTRATSLLTASETSTPPHAQSSGRSTPSLQSFLAGQLPCWESCFWFGSVLPQTRLPRVRLRRRRAPGHRPAGEHWP